MFESLDLGGAERQALHLAQYLRDTCRAQLKVWAFGWPGRAAELCERYGIPWEIFPLKWPPGRVAKLAELAAFALKLRRSQPDVLMPYTIFPNVVCGLTWRWTAARTCIWNQRDEGLHKTSPRSEKAAIRATPVFAANSRTGADFLSYAFGVAPGRVSVIPNGVQLAPAASDRKAWRVALGRREPDFIACMVANFHHHKDHATLLAAWRYVLDWFGIASGAPLLILVGRFGGTQATLMAQARSLGLQDYVHFMDHVTDISGLLTAVDLGILSSESEGCPNAVLEYMASGLAVVGTDIAGIRDVVGERGYPYLAPPRDPGTLARRILVLAQNPDLRRQIGQDNRQRAEVEFSLQRMCEQSAALIARSLGIRT